MKVLRLVPLVLIVAACSSVNVPLSPYRIDVQQGNALEQESVEKLKLGLTRSQVRFLLGTPLLVDPFHGNRWDYVYNFRKAGKLTEERRLVLFFEGDVLARIEAEGLTLKNEQPEAKPAAPEKSLQKAVEQPKAAAVETVPVAVATPLEPAKPIQSVPVADAEAAGKQAEPAPVQAVAAPVANAQPASVAATEAPAKAKEAAPVRPVPAETGERSLEKTSIVAPLVSEQGQAAKSPAKPVALSAAPPEPVALQTAANVDAIKPDVMPEFPDAAPAGSQEAKVVEALNAWAEAWRTRDEESYLAAYAPSFRPAGGQTREEWEKRRRLLLGVSRNIDLQIDGVAAEAITEDRAQVSFRQFYRSDSYRDAVIKQLKFVRVDNRWLIEEENVLSSIKGYK